MQIVRRSFSLPLSVEGLNIEISYFGSFLLSFQKKKEHINIRKRTSCHQVLRVIHHRCSNFELPFRLAKAGLREFGLIGRVWVNQTVISDCF